MTALPTTPQHSRHWVVRLGFCLGVLILLLLLLIRLLLPQLATYRTELETAVGAYLGLPVHVERLSADWQGWEPVLQIQGFSLHDPDNSFPIASFQQAWISLDLFRSVLSWRPVPRYIRLQGGRLSLTREAHSGLSIAPQSPRGTTLSLAWLATWLLPIRSLDVTLTEVQLPPFAAGAGPILRDVRLSLRDQAGQRRLGLSVDLPEELGRHLSLVLVLDTDNPNPTAWQGAVYARAEDVQLAGWPLPLALPTTGRMSSLELWGDWQALRFTRLRGRADFQDLAFRASNDTVQLGLPESALLTTEFTWQATDQGWQWRSDWQGENAAGQPTVGTAVDLNYVTPETDQPGQLEGGATHLRLQELTPLLQPWLNEQQRLWLERLTPTGNISTLTWRVPFNGVKPIGDYTVTARFQDFSTRAWERLPAVANLTGTVTLVRNGGRLQLDTEQFQFNADSLRKPIAGEKLRGVIDWQQQVDGQLHIKTTALEFAATGLTSTLRGTATLAANHANPLLDVTLDYALEDLSRIKAYLPRKMMKPKLVKWLDRALVSGRVDAGQLTVRGRIGDFPFADGQGVFEARQQVHDAVADYAPGWPRLENMEAEVVFRNRTFQMKASAGTLLDAKLEQATAHINDLSKAVVEIEGLARGPASTVLSALRDSPLTKKIGPYIAGMQATGKNTLALALTVPLDERPVQARGAVGFTGNTLQLPDHGVKLNRVQGELQFADQSLTARDIQLVLRGESALLDIDTHELPDKPAINFTLRGRWELPALANNDQLIPYITGKTPWKMVLNVPTGRIKKRLDFALELTSELQGATVKLPAPLGKAAVEQRSLRLNARRSGNQNVQLRLDYGPDTQAILEWTDWPQQPHFHRGALQIGTGPAQLPTDPGLIVNVHFPRWRLAMPPQTQETAAPGFPPWLTRLTARFDELLIGDRSIPDLTLNVLPQDGRMAMLLEGATLAGRLWLPTQGSGAPVQGVLDRLALEPRAPATASHSTQQAPLDPRRLPPLDITVQDLRWEGRSLGILKLLTQPQPEGMRVVDLHLQSAQQELTATGDWLITEQGPVSRIQAGLNSTDLGETLRLLGYASGLEGGETRAELTASWRGSLPDFSPTRLDGYLDFEIGDGQLLNVDPGMGRIFSLLNLYNLTRRLRLDFSDLFEKGLSFDRIQGGFTFADGRAYTDDFSLEGPTADIAIQGQVDLIERRYDQVIAVTPHVGTPLTIAGTIAGGPVVGAAAFLAERLLKSGIDQVTRYYYTLTGPWEEPLVERIEQPATSGDAPITGDGGGS